MIRRGYLKGFQVCLNCESFQLFPYIPQLSYLAARSSFFSSQGRFFSLKLARVTTVAAEIGETVVSRLTARGQVRARTHTLSSQW